MRVPFSQVFTQNQDGTYTPKLRVKIGGVTMGQGVSFSSGVSFAGVDLAQHASKDLEVEQYADGTVEIKGFYQ